MDARTCEHTPNLPKNKLIGKHNQINISNAAQFSLQPGISEDLNFMMPVTDFEGIERRLEKIGSFRQMDVYDDYAHNPMKIEATITALKEAYPNPCYVCYLAPTCI